MPRSKPGTPPVGPPRHEGRLVAAGTRRPRRDLGSHVCADNPSAAIRVDADLADAVAGLGDHPELGRPGLIPGARELFPIHSSRIVYKLGDDEVQVLAIAHTSRLWPR